jgi:DSF synthase
MGELMSIEDQRQHAADVDDPLKEFEVEYDSLKRILWVFLNPKLVPSFTSSLLAQLYEHDCALTTDEQGNLYRGPQETVDYYIWASRTPRIYSLGGDLAYFAKCIEAKDRKGLMHYAIQCIDTLHLRVCNYRARRLITVALIQGDALGGGFEAALASDVIIAEEQARFGLPEILFNLFPGMGAYSLLSRRIGSVLTEKLMMSGTTYSAAQCYEMGLVDVVVHEGKGEQAVYEYVHTNRKRRNGVTAIYEARRSVLSVTHQELMTITTQWVDAALNLQGRDLRLMMRLVHRQHARLAGCH